MDSKSNRKVVPAAAVVLVLAAALSGCYVKDGGRPNPAMPGGSTVPPRQPVFPFPGYRQAANDTTAAGDGSHGYGVEPSSPREPILVTDTVPAAGPTAWGPIALARGPDAWLGTPGSEQGETGEDLVLSSSGGTTPGGQSLAEHPRNNVEAADLLDHWGHRRIDAIRTGLSVADPAAGSNADQLRTLRRAAQGGGETSVAVNLHDDDEIRILGARHGVTYGRWAGGPADTLSIDFDLSYAGPLMRYDPAFRAMLERAGKVWSHRIDDTWTAWKRRPGEVKGHLSLWGISGTPTEEVRVGEEGETSTGLEIIVRDMDFTDDHAGRGGASYIQPSRNSWEPHFGSVAIARGHLRTASRVGVFATLTHEIGHVLGAWTVNGLMERYSSYIDDTTGTWTGPNVVAAYGGAAPFQDENDPHAWVLGARNLLASNFDYGHSGGCVSIMSYCRSNSALPSFGPQAIDFAFLADLGLTIREETDRPETYGLTGWTDYAGFTVSVSRRLQMALADPQPHYGFYGGPWQTFDVVDLLQAEVDAFGYLSTGNYRVSHAAEGPDGTVRYAGGLIGTALDHAGLPPVTGDALLAVDLATLTGSAGFTSLKVYPDGVSETFAGGTLHYPIAVSDNAISGTETVSTLAANFYGPKHDDLAGVLHDPRAGLLAGFGATLDDRPDHEDVIAAADYLAAISYTDDALNSADEGWRRYRCGTVSGCETQHAPPGAGGWTDWTTTSRELVLASTTGWALRNAARPAADHDFVRIARLSSAATDGARGRHVTEAYIGTLKHAAFGVGFEWYSNWETEPETTSPDFRYRSAGVGGTLSGSLPGERAQWAGRMIGYQSSHGWNQDPFVEGLATIDYWLSTNVVDVAFSDIASRDDLRTAADFGFAALPTGTGGTFSGGGGAGIIRGALFGSAQEEAGGMFHHNAAGVTGSFGAERVPDTVTLEETGDTRVAFSSQNASGPYDVYEYDRWGFWGRQFQANLFGAFMEQRITTVGSRSTYHAPHESIEGTPSGSNPVSGTAVWLGKVHAVERDSSGYMPVSGNAQIEVSFRNATVNVDFTDFEAGHSDMSWRALRIGNGAFRDPQVGTATIDGAFFGAQHQGAAGKFDHNGLRGVFGAVRN